MFDLRLKKLNGKKKSMTQDAGSYILSWKLHLMYFKAKVQQGRCRWCNYKLECHKTVEKPYLEANKQQRRYRLTYLDVLKLEEEYGWCFEGQSTAWKLIEAFLGVINKQVKACLVYLKCKTQQDRYVWCIYKFKCHKTVQRRYLVTSKQQTKHRWCF